MSDVRMHEVAHALAFTLKRANISDGGRRVILDFMEAGYTQEGEFKGWTDEQRAKITCLDCPDHGLCPTTCPYHALRFGSGVLSQGDEK